jgi:uncharacterized protein YdiU (UPF0061 family)
MSFSIKSIPLHNAFLELGEQFLSEVKPTPLKQESMLIHFNQSAADLLDFEKGIEKEQSFVDIFSGTKPFQTATPFPCFMPDISLAI